MTPQQAEKELILQKKQRTHKSTIDTMGPGYARAAQTIESQDQDLKTKYYKREQLIPTIVKLADTLGINSQLGPEASQILLSDVQQLMNIFAEQHEQIVDYAESIQANHPTQKKGLEGYPGENTDLHDIRDPLPEDRGVNFDWDPIIHGNFNGTMRDVVAKALVTALNPTTDPDLNNAINAGQITPPEGSTFRPEYRNYIDAKVLGQKPKYLPNTNVPSNSKALIRSNNNTRSPENPIEKKYGRRFSSQLMVNVNDIIGDEETKRTTYEVIIVDPIDYQGRVKKMKDASHLILDHAQRLVCTNDERHEKMAANAIYTMSALINNKEADRKTITTMFVDTLRSMCEATTREEMEALTIQIDNIRSTIKLPEIPSSEAMIDPQSNKIVFQDKEKEEQAREHTGKIGQILKTATLHVGGTTRTGISNDVVLEIPTSLDTPLLYWNPSDFGQVFDKTRGAADSLAFMVAAEHLIKKAEERNKDSRDKMIRRSLPSSYIFFDPNNIIDGAKQYTEEHSNRFHPKIETRALVPQTPPTPQEPPKTGITALIQKTAEAMRPNKKPADSPDKIAKNARKLLGK